MNSDSLIYKIARLYYERNLTQQEIANRYGISRIKVSRLLARAINEKIVQIRITEPENPFSEQEHQLEEKYQLDEVIIAEARTDVEKEVIESIGIAGASYIAGNLQGDETIGITWGRALNSLINNLPSLNYPDLKVVQMLGGLGQPEAEFHGAELTRRMAQAFGTRPRLIHSPAILKTAELCDELKNDDQVKDTLQLAVHADIALVGIGWFDDNSPIIKNKNILPGPDIMKLKELKAAGDISLRFFDGDGNFIHTDLDNRIVGLSTDEILSIPRRIGVAGGKSKYNTVKAAITGKLINVLITDQHTALNLLQN
jgi:DNA-binding transcriptional regulator LsrR (DeoR family)